MTTKHKAFTRLATAATVLTAALATPAVSVSAAHLTKATAAAAAKRDAQAAAVISGGDVVKVTGCHPIRGGAYTCQVELIPVKSSSRCRWTSTIRLVKGKPAVVGYSRAHCTN
jgi:hypothetical protein